MKIGILQTGHAPKELLGELGDYADMFARLLNERGFSFETYSVVDDQFPAGPEDADGWLISGSRHAAYDGFDWIRRLEGLIRDIRDSGRPLIGVCFGHQIIAQALGGRVEKFKGGWAVGAQRYDFGGKEMVLNAWHQDQVVVPPEGAQVIAGNAFCENAALLIGDRILTIQPHPEFGTDMIAGLIRYRGKGNISDDLLEKAEADLSTVTDAPAFADRMEAHFKKGAR